MYKVVIVLLISTKVQSLNISLNTENVCEDILLENITKTYFNNRSCLTIIRLSEDYPKILFSQATIPTLVKRVNLTKLTPHFNLTTRPRRDRFDRKRSINSLCSESHHGYLIIVKVMQDLINYMFTEIVMPFWSPQAYTFIYFTQEICHQNTTNFFENLWSIYKTPHVVISGCKCNNILFYNPYIYHENKYGQLLNFSKEEVLKNPDLIQNKMKNFNGYPVKAMVFKSPFSVPVNNKEYVGIDINTVTDIADNVNMTTKIILPLDNEQYGFKLPNGTYTGAIGVLLTGEIDYISVDYFIKDYLTIDIEFSSSMSTDNLCVIMRKAEKIPDWQLLYFCMDKITWICIITIYFVIALSWITIQYILIHFKEEAVLYPFVFTDTFRLMITSSLFRLPTITSERLFLAFCLMAFVTLVGAFQGSLIGVYSTLMFYNDIDTLEDLSRTETQIKSKYMFFIDDVFSDVSYPVIAKLKSMISFYDDPVSITQRVATQKDFATLVRQSEVEIDNSTTTYLDEKGVNLIHMVKECPRTYSLANIFPVNSAIAPVFNMVILRIAQAGLLVKWYDEMAFNVSDSASRRNAASLSDALKIFSLKDMQISFYQLVIGMGVGTIIFFLEMCMYNCNKHKFPEYKSQ